MEVLCEMLRAKQTLDDIIAECEACPYVARRGNTHRVAQFFKYIGVSQILLRNLCPGIYI